MKDISFSEKMKKLSQHCVLGTDINGFVNVEDIYEKDLDVEYNQTIEGEFLEELRNGIDGERASRFFDLLSSVIGTRRAEGIREELLARLGYFENKSQERFEERNLEVHRFQEKVDEIEKNNREEKHGAVKQTKEMGDFSREETGIFMRDVSDNLYEAIEVVERNYRDKCLSEMATDVVEKYKLRMNRNYEGFYKEYDNIDNEIENEIESEQKKIYDESVKAFCNEVGKSPEELSAFVRQRYSPDSLGVGDNALIELGPPESQVKVAPVELPYEFEADVVKIYFSEKMIKDSEYGKEDLFQGGKYRFYRNQREGAVEYTALTEDEGKRLELRSQTLSDARICADEDKQIEDKSKDHDYEVHVI